MADRLKLSAEITSAGRWKAGAELRAGPKSAHHTSPRPINLPLPVREQATRGLGGERLPRSLLVRLFRVDRLRQSGIDLSGDVALLFVGKMPLQRLDEDAAAWHAPPASGTLRGLEQPLRQGNRSLDGPIVGHAAQYTGITPSSSATAHGRCDSTATVGPMRVATSSVNPVKQRVPRPLPCLAQRQPVAGRVRAARVDRRARQGSTPSDHAPLIVAVAATASPMTFLTWRQLEAIVFS